MAWATAGAQDRATKTAELRLLALGDSYTIGEGVAAEERWPSRLVEALRRRGLAVAAPTLVARTGWTTDELAAGIDATELAPPYDLVTLMVGVNNQYRGREVGEFTEQLTELAGRAVAFTGGRPGRVLVISIPDWGVTPFASDRERPRIAAEIDAFNAAAGEVAGSLGCRWVDVTGLSRVAGPAPAMLAEDGLHPSARQHAAWAEAVEVEAVEALSG
jgi:lysophospholipase L1-like esterase